MSLSFASIASGSNGNCYYVGNATDAVLIDAGISCRQIEVRMNKIGLQMQKVRAVFVSHEHTDHICGLPVLARKWNLPVYVTHQTLNSSGLQSQLNNTKTFRCSVPVNLGELEITPFYKSHDAADPHSFVVSCGGIRVGIFTDIGNPCDKLMMHFSQCHAAFLEANYDENMLNNGSYPYYLKARIRSDKGHLSNMQALELFKSYRSVNLSHLILGHLSGNNNTPQIVEQLFNEHAKQTNIIVASRHEQSELYDLQVSASLQPKRTSPLLQQMQFAF